MVRLKTLIMLSLCACSVAPGRVSMPATVAGGDDLQISRNSLTVDDAQVRLDDAIKTAVVDVFSIDHELKRAVFSVTSFKGRVLIAGGVADAELLPVASRLAWSVEGVRDVLNYVEVEARPIAPGALRLDEFIYNDISERIRNSPVDGRAYRIVIYRKKAYVLGETDSRAELRRLFGIIRRTEGISNIVNLVKVR